MHPPQNGTIGFDPQPFPQSIPYHRLLNATSQSRVLVYDKGPPLCRSTSNRVNLKWGCGTNRKKVMNNNRGVWYKCTNLWYNASCSLLWLTIPFWPWGGKELRCALATSVFTLLTKIRTARNKRDPVTFQLPNPWTPIKSSQYHTLTCISSTAFARFPESIGSPQKQAPAGLDQFVNCLILRKSTGISSGSHQSAITPATCHPFRVAKILRFDHLSDMPGPYQVC